MSLKSNLFVTILLTVELFSAGGSPMMTDGTGTPQKGQWEVNLASSGSYHKKNRYYEAPIIDINYGLNETIQLKAETAFVFVDDTAQKESGLGNMEIGLKWRFYEHDGLSFSTYPQYIFAPVRKNLKNGVAQDEQALFLPLEAHKEFDDFGVTFEVGYLGSKGNKSSLESGILFNYALNDKIELLAELHRDAHFDASDETVALNAGCTYLFYPNTSWLFSIGREIEKSSKPKSSLFYIGLQLLF